MVLLFISKTNAPHLKTEVLDVVSAEYQYIGNLNFVINVSLKVKFDRKVFNILRFSSFYSQCLFYVKHFELTHC